MANELTVSTGLRLSKGGVTAAVDLSAAIDITTERKLELTQVIGTTEEAVSLVDVVAPRYIVVSNLDATNFVEIGTVTGQYPIKLKPSDFAIFPPNQTTLFAKADTAACLLYVLAVNT